MNNKKRILAIAAVICVLSGSMAYAEYDPDKVIDPTNPIMTLSSDGEAEDTPRAVNGATLPSVTVKEVNGVKMIPLRSVAEGCFRVERGETFPAGWERRGGRHKHAPAGCGRRTR